MELIVLGSGCGIPSATRGAPGLALLVAGRPLLLDSGSGTLERLVRAGIPYGDVDTLFYTHRHNDHTADLGPFLQASNIPGYQRERDLTIVAPKGFRNFFERMLALYPWLRPATYGVNVREVWQSRLRVAGCMVETGPTFHTADSVGYRLTTEGKTIVYSGDAAYDRSVVKLARNADLLVLECSFPDELEVRGHLTPALAGRIARQAEARRLLLTHFYPVCDEYDVAGQCRAEYDGQIILAEDNLRIEV